MATDPVMIIGVGIVSPVGLTAAETAASVRSGVMRFSESALLDREFDPYTTAEVPDDGLRELPETLRADRAITARQSRLLRLAGTALPECCSVLAANLTPRPIALALPEHETALPLDGAVFLSRLARQVGCVFNADLSIATHRGRAGGIAAVGHAAMLIRAGHTEFAIAGGVDTFCDPYVLSALDAEERVKSERATDRFIPGEGAAFLLLASPAAAAAANVAPLAQLSAVTLGFEPGHLYSAEPYRGDGLAATFAQLVQLGDIPAPLAEVFSSMNGESHWAKEWGVGYLRSRAAFRPTYGMHHPADCLGDTGAACGPLLIGLAAVGIRDRYRGSPSLVYGSSDRGQRAAVVVSRVA
jgi:3-oxoacyl-[acyl-carrier-protein] synthase I